MRSRTLWSYVLAVSILLLLSRCEIINPEERTPAFIQIDSLHFVTDGEEGTATAELIDAWIEVNNQSLGAYELPATIPVLEEGTVDLKVFGGIRFNGRNMDRRVYPFYQFSQADIDLVPGAVSQVSEEAATIGYIDGLLAFDIIDFEDVGIPLVATSASDTIIERVPNPDPAVGYLENWVGRISVGPERSSFDIETDRAYDLGGQNIVMLEFDYKTETTLFLGVKSEFPTNNAVGLLGINPSNGPNNTFVWKKMYVDLSNVVDFLQNPPELELFFQGESPDAPAEIYLDNIKVIHPQ